jgi:UDP-2,3-diacylglucosamine hydrolase
MAILFVSDLHLGAECPATTAAFLAFLVGPARQAEGLYILGDLFELWIGDDAPQPEDLPVLAALRELTDTGIPLQVMHGNRDFLYGERFATTTGCRLLLDPYLVDLYGTPTLLMHGDLLCTDDHDYQRFRRVVRDPHWQAAQLAQPAAIRLALARRLREQSHLHTAGKAEAIMDVNQATVEATLRTYSVFRLIHGHTHRVAHHRFLLDGQEAQRIVLPDWYAGGGYLECTGEGCRLRDWR